MNLMTPQALALLEGVPSVGFSQFGLGQVMAIRTEPGDSISKKVGQGSHMGSVTIEADPLLLHRGMNDRIGFFQALLQLRVARKT